MAETNTCCLENQPCRISIVEFIIQQVRQCKLHTHDMKQNQILYRHHSDWANKSAANTGCLFLHVVFILFTWDEKEFEWIDTHSSGALPPPTHGRVHYTQVIHETKLMKWNKKPPFIPSLIHSIQQIMIYWWRKYEVMK